MDYSWLTTSWSSILMVTLTTIGIYVTLITYTRLAGLRSFSKMSGFDFAVTVAIGSLLASTVLTKDPPLIQAMVALGLLYILQVTIGKLRGRSKWVTYAVDNQPLLLMRGSEILDDNLREAEVTRDDLRAKLREANVTQLSQVKAVVMEATGDVSVLHNEDPAHELDSLLLKKVRGWNTD